MAVVVTVGGRSNKDTCVVPITSNMYMHIDRLSMYASIPLANAIIQFHKGRRGADRFLLFRLVLLPDGGEYLTRRCLVDGKLVQTKHRHAACNCSSKFDQNREKMEVAAARMPSLTTCGHIRHGRCGHWNIFALFRLHPSEDPLFLRSKSHNTSRKKKKQFTAKPNRRKKKLGNKNLPIIKKKKA